MKRVVKILECGAFNAFGKEHEGIVEEDGKSIKRNFNYVPLCFFTVVLISASPFTNLNEKPFFIDMWFPFDARGSWSRYFCVYLHSFVGKFVCDRCLFML